MSFKTNRLLSTVCINVVMNWVLTSARRLQCISNILQGTVTSRILLAYVCSYDTMSSSFSFFQSIKTGSGQLILTDSS